MEDATQEILIDNWQISGNAERRDVFSHPKVVAAIYAVSADEIAAEKIIAAIRCLAVYSAPTAFSTDDLRPLAGTIVERVYALAQWGTRNSRTLRMAEAM